MFARLVSARFARFKGNLKWRQALAVALLLSLTMCSDRLTPAQSSASETLNNQTIIKLVKGGLDDNFIIQTIHTHPGHYLLDHDNQVKLTQAGVSAKVMMEMAAKNAEGSPAPSGASQPSASVRRDSKWHAHDEVDGMTGNKFIAVTLHDVVESNGRTGTAELTAACSSEALKFDLVYLGDSEKDLGFRLTQPDASISYNQVQVPTPEVHMRVRVDDAPVKIVTSASDHPNEAFIYFMRVSAKQAMARMNTNAGSHSMTPILQLLVAGGGAGSIDEAFHAQVIKFELPLANGDNPVLTIHPQDSAFQAFGSRCHEAYPPPKEMPMEGEAAWTPSAPDVPITVLGEARLIPKGGARFVPVTHAEAEQIVIKQWDPVNVATAQYYYPQYIARFQAAELLPARTECAPLETVKPKNMVAVIPKDAKKPIPVGIRMGMSNAELVKLVDGRLGLVPHNDLYTGYPGERMRAADLILQAPFTPRGPSQQDEAPADKQFTGTVEEFSAAFPGFLSRAAAYWQIDPQVYKGEADYILDVARTCAELTPEKLDKVRNPDDDSIDLTQFQNGRYKECNQMGVYVSQVIRNLPTPYSVPGRGLGFSGPRRSRFWPDGRSFALRIKLSRVSTDPPYDANNPYPPGYWVVDANIKASAGAR